MSKKYKGKLCVYCANDEAAGADHIFAREFFLVEDRHDLPKVPACTACNRRKSGLEHYAVSVLPFAGRHPTALANLETLVPKRLRKNARLHRELNEGRRTMWTEATTGIHVPMMALPFDGKAIEALFSFIGRGLLWHHWHSYLSSSDAVSVTFLTDAGHGLFDRLLGMRARDRVSVSLGNGTFTYEGGHGVDCDQLSVWQIAMFGGAQLVDAKVRGGVSSAVGIMTGAAEQLSRAMTGT